MNVFYVVVFEKYKFMNIVDYLNYYICVINFV